MSDKTPTPTPTPDSTPARSLFSRLPSLLATRAALLSAPTASYNTSPATRSAVSDPTARRAAALSELDRSISLARAALSAVPARYRRAVYLNLTRETPFPAATARSCRRWRKRAVEKLALDLERAES